MLDLRFALPLLILFAGTGCLGPGTSDARIATEEMTAASGPLELTLVRVHDVRPGRGTLWFRVDVELHNTSEDPVYVLGYSLAELKVNLHAETRAGEWPSTSMGSCGTGLTAVPLAPGQKALADCGTLLRFQEGRLELLDLLHTPPTACTGRVKVLASYMPGSSPGWAAAASAPFDVPLPEEFAP